ncbi:MAG TPA: ornithine carbamoyltransferase [bacterium]|nr:ornithine carbamoyltransferase [bacterium]
MPRKKRDLLTLLELSDKELLGLLKSAAKIKAKPSKYKKALKGQALAMIFEKTSTRTRVSFEVGMAQLGGQALFLGKNDIQLGKGETIPDTARVLSRMVQGIMARVYAHKTLEDLARYSSVPVINGLSDGHHPCQCLADLLTIQEHKGKLKGLQLVYVGDGNNVAHSLLIGAAKTGMHLKVVCPRDYAPQAGILAAAKKEAARTGSRLEIVHEVRGSVKGADAVYTDVWTSMGQEAEQQKRLKAFAGYQVDEKLMGESPKALFLHCLPANRGEEVSAGVIDGPQSVVWDQAENRLHAQKALLVALMGHES